MKILAIQNRMGIGDTVIFLPFIEAISKKYHIPIDLLVRESSKTEEFLNETSYINKIHTLDRNFLSNGRHDGILGFFNLVRDIRKENFDKIFIFNSSLRFNLIGKFSKAKEIIQYPLLNKKDQHIINTAKKFIKENINVSVETNAKIFISHKNVEEAVKQHKINKDKKNILLGIGGSGPTKRIPSQTFIKVIEMISKVKNCNFYLATGQNKEEQIILREIMNSEFCNLCLPIDKLTIAETLPIIKNCQASICNDTSFSHLSAALGVNTITLMADTPLMYGSYSPRMYPITPDGVTEVSHHTSGKDKINPIKIYKKLLELLN